MGSDSRPIFQDGKQLKNARVSRGGEKDNSWKFGTGSVKDSFVELASVQGELHAGARFKAGAGSSDLRIAIPSEYFMEICTAMVSADPQCAMCAMATILANELAKPNQK
jgi:hypothetical protein